MKKRTIAGILAALTVWACIAVFPVGARESGDWEYEVNEDGKSAVITMYTGEESDLAVPAKIDGYTVTAIGEGAFLFSEGLTRVTLPEGLTAIGEGAFLFCDSLTQVTLPASLVSIGDEAFEGCMSLESITIPAGVTEIGMGAFSECVSLTGIEVHPENAAYKSVEGVVYSKDETELVVCPAGTSLTDFTVPHGVLTLCDMAFSGCEALERVALPEGVTYIGMGTFAGCISLEGIVIPEGVSVIGEGAFFACQSLTEIAIPGSVESIGDFAFAFCDALTTVYYGGSAAQWSEISMGEDNEALLNADVIFDGDVLVGDLNGDGKINSRDVILLMKLVLEADPEVSAVTDVNGDGKINSRDVIALMKLILEQ